MRGVFGVACGLVLAGSLVLPASAQECRLDLRPDLSTKIKMAGAPLDTGVVRLTNLRSGAASLPELNVGDIIALQLFDDVELTVRLTECLMSPIGGSSFLATVDGYDGMMNAVVIQTAEGLQVDIQDFKNSRVYTVFSSESGTTVREIDPNAGEVKACEPLIPESTSSRLKLATADQASTVIDILVAYDANAAIWAKANGGGLDNFALTAVAKMNTALANNGLSSNFRFRLVGTTEVSVYKTDVHDALYAISDGASGWAAIKTKREEVGADIVTTLIDTGSAHGTTGVGWSLSGGTVASFAESAYNVCAIRAVAQSHTMTHEVGHNMGAGHATAVDPDQISPGPQYKEYSAGYYFTANSKKYHTIMAYNYDGFGNSYSSAPLFSSPDCTWEGVKAGDATHDNARTIAETYAEVTKWRAQKVALSYDVFFSPEPNTLFDSSVTVTLTPGKAGLPIRYTTDGSTPTLSSKLYSGPFTLKTTTTVKAATVNGGVLGPVYEARYLKSDLGTALNAPQLNWTTSSDYPWVSQTDNTYDGFAAQSCPDFISNNGCRKTSWIKTTITGPTEMTFRYQKRQYSSKFRVYCDSAVLWEDSDGASTIGSSNWSLAMVEIPSGKHEIKFTFEQGGGYYSSFNGIVLDDLGFDKLAHSPTISPKTTDSQSTAMTYTGSMVVTITPPSGRTGKIFYTLDGSDPNSASAVEYTGPITITRSVYVQALFVEPGKEPSELVKGYFLERHPVKAGEWTTDVEGAKTAAAKDGKLIAVLCANQAGCGWTQRFTPIAESPEFLAWAAANGVYLITSDTYGHVDTAAAHTYFWNLWNAGSVGYPSLAFAKPSAPEVCVATGTARKSTSDTVAGVPYEDTVESLVKGFAAAMGVTSIPSRPTISPDQEYVDSLPLTVTLTNPNGSGTLYYTLDGTNPATSATRKVYSGAITITDKTSILTAVVKNSSGVYGLPLVRSFALYSDYVNGYFGSSDIVWKLESTVGWQESDYEGKKSLRTGGYLNGTKYTSTLIAKVSGKGKFRFSYKFCNWNAANTMEYRVNGVVEKRIAKSITTNYAIETVELSIDGATTIDWTYAVAYPDNDYTSGYSATSGKSAWCGLWLYDVEWIPENAATSTTPVAVPHTWIAAKFPSAATSSYETLMNADSDGDGYTNWEEYLCGTDPNGGATTQTDAVPRCTIRFENGVPVIEHNIAIPSVAKSAGWKVTVKGSSDLKTWSAADNGKHKYFKVVVEK